MTNTSAFVNGKEYPSIEAAMSAKEAPADNSLVVVSRPISGIATGIVKDSERPVVARVTYTVSRIRLDFYSGGSGTFHPGESYTVLEAPAGAGWLHRWTEQGEPKAEPTHRTEAERWSLRGPRS